MHAPSVEEEISKEDVVTFIADITSGTEPGKKLLNDLGFVGIPLIVVYGPAVEEPLTAETWTSESAIELIHKARGSD